MQRFIEAKYPDLFRREPFLSRQIYFLEILALQKPRAIATPIATSQTGTASPVFNIHFDHRRSLNRLHTLYLILENDYERFVAQQREAPLTRESFDQMRAFLSDFSVEILIFAIAIMASPLNESIKALSMRAVSDSTAISMTDSVLFMEQTVKLCPQIYALPGEYEKDFQAAFLSDSHLRHMLFAEGDQFMYQQLSLSEISSSQMKLWFARWILDVLSFAVETNDEKDPRSSKGFNEEMFRDIWFIWNQLNTLPAVEYPKIAQTHLVYKAKSFNYSDLPPLPQAVATRLALLSVISPTDPKLEELKTYVLNTFTENEAKFREQFEPFLPEGKHRTPIHGPALLRGLLKASNNMTQTLELALPFYKEAWKIYQAREFNIALSFFHLGQASAISKILNGELVASRLAVNEKMEIIEGPSSVTFATERNLASLTGASLQI